MGIYLNQPNTEKHFSEAEKGGRKAASAEMQGWRRSMEDAFLIEISADEQTFPSLFGVFDGHGGLEVSNLAARVFLEQFKTEFSANKEDVEAALDSTFMGIDVFLYTPKALQLVKQIRQDKDKATSGGMSIEQEGKGQPPNSGTTACVCAIFKGVLYCANAGDSRAVLATKGVAKQLSFDHKPDNEKEKERIQAAGGNVAMGRIDSGLNLSRALGDLPYKDRKDLPPDRQKVIAKPDITKHELTKEDSWLLIGCDGVWENYVDSCQSMVDTINKLLQDSTGSGKEALSKLLDKCLAPKVSEKGCDNMTAVIVQFTSA